ncbi:hypothetical protein JCM19239_1358 [Vibrio variabilis]|uniref:Uncharacterized protein n=1 Tax=Vibrio variabilis TaxID=990271 RepID=A0ABQ0JR56_9VIBR|nr:hypothetical protein JCM19239_1358 [Vibrio variabilis]
MKTDIPIQVQRLNDSTLLCTYESGKTKMLHNSELYSEDCRQEYLEVEAQFAEQITPSEEPMNVRRQAAIRATHAEVERVLAPIRDAYPSSEIDSWPIQVNEARAYLADNAAVTPTIDAIVSDEDKRAFCEGLIAKADDYATQVGRTIAWRRAVHTFIGQASSQALNDFTPTFPILPGATNE